MTATAVLTSQVIYSLQHYGQIKLQNILLYTSKCSQGLQEWTKVFPRNVTETYTSSATFMKQLTVVAISTITYLKNAFPEDNYEEDIFGGLKIKVLKTKCTDDLAQFLITSMTHAFEAFDKKYVSFFFMLLYLLFVQVTYLFKHIELFVCPVCISLLLL